MKPAPQSERDVGIGWYVTDGPPCAARLKDSAEDFLVEEKISVPDLVPEPRIGYLPLYRVNKRSIDTMHMARELSEELRSRVSYAGLKDKRAVAVQYVTPVSRRAASPSEVVRERFTANLIGYVPRPLSRSSMVGNSFSVVLRQCCPEVGNRASEALQAATGGRIPNFFGLQRFGAGGAGSHKVGREVVRGDFEQAVKLMLAGDRRFGGGPGGELSEALGAGEYGRVARLLPPARDAELAAARELARHPGDWVRALRAVPIDLRRLYVQAYQSFIFNETMSTAVEKGEDISKMATGDNWAEASPDGLVVSLVRGVKDAPAGNATPMVQMVGYAFRDYGSRFDLCARKVLAEEGITPRQFYVSEMQEVSQEGGFRRSHLVVRDPLLRIDAATATLEFTLPRGQYATVLLREVMKDGDPGPAGLA